MGARCKYWLAGTIAVLSGLRVMLVPISLLIGWNLATMIIFWYLLVPVFTVGVSWRLFKDKNPIWVPLLGLIIFYGGLIFMTYDHYLTDYFDIMLVSLATNLIMVTGTMLVARHRPRSRAGQE